LRKFIVNVYGLVIIFVVGHFDVNKSSNQLLLSL